MLRKPQLQESLVWL